MIEGPVASYPRVSSHRQKERETIEMQRDAIQRFCAMNHVTVDFEYPDDGASGTLNFQDREGGRRLLTDAAQGKFRTLLVYKIDRLGRDKDVLIALQTMALLRNLGIRVIFITQPAEDDDNGRLIMTVLAAFSSHEHSQIKQRTMDGSRRLADKGGFMGGRYVTYGYRVIRIGKDPFLTPNTDLIPNFHMSEVQVVIMIYEMSAAGKSCEVIAKHLNAMGVPAPGSAQEWLRERIQDLLKLPIYKGFRVHGRRKAVPLNDETRFLKSGRPRKMKYRQEVRPEKDHTVREMPELVLVPPEVWNRAQATLKKHQIMKRRESNKYLLSGMVRCDKCNHGYIGHRSKRPSGKMEFYYHRYHGDRLPRDPIHVCPAVSGEWLENAVWAKVSDLVYEPGPVLSEIEDQLGPARDFEKRAMEDIKRLEARLASKNAEIFRINDRYFKGRIDESRLDKYLRPAEAEKEAIEYALAAARQGTRTTDFRGTTNGSRHDSS